MKWLISYLLLLQVSSFADTLSVNIYNGTTSQSPIKQGAKQVTFVNSLTGSIGNAALTSASLINFQILAERNGGRLNAIPYTVTSGNCIIIEVR